MFHIMKYIIKKNNITCSLMEEAASIQLPNHTLAKGLMLTVKQTAQEPLRITTRALVTGYSCS
jgi:hypothetical protein